MALIQCPECGKQVSDRADKCPECGCPIVSIKNDLVSIKLEKIGNSLQTVTISINGSEVWEGKSGDVAQLHINEKCEIKVHYGLNLKFMPASIKSTIDPNVSSKYIVRAKHDILYRTILDFQIGDFIVVK